MKIILFVCTMTVSFILGSYLCDQNDQVDTRLSSSATLAASMTSAADANAAQETPPASLPQKPQWYWVGSNVSTYGDYGGHIADATAPLDFANGEVTRRKVDTLLELLRHQCTWTFDDSLQAAIKLIRDHPELVETKGKNPKQGKQH